MPVSQPSTAARTPRPSCASSGSTPSGVASLAALPLLDQLQPRRRGLRLVAGGAGEMGAEQRVDEVPNAAAFLAPVDGAYRLQLAHDLRTCLSRPTVRGRGSASG